ncbi:autotransporter outer membrane beta-barrel domain-containing protein [Psychrobacter sp. NG25]|uniref:choice-of-anchor F family protein n=1 Tax=Psychrobacter sp. NG25 TaxID=2782005 RepID=UPI0018832AE3|nr:choice-of-anchor F family protein [Psychrobacter sp. NG25]MBF0658068.1 autotransporter outer membrane beta-barrel domain-containing protein [Psychrobacter sp. NG25]
MKIKKYLLVSVAPVALVVPLTITHADTFDTDAFIGTSGGGFVYVDEKENVVEPGIKAITFTATRGDEYTNENPVIVEPYDRFTTSFSDLDSRGIVTNCLMASNEALCDSISGSGKRIKNYLTGMDPFDTHFRTSTKEYINTETDEPIDTSSVDYFTFGKMSNFTGARITGFNIELLDKDGNLMDELDPDNTALFNLDVTDIGLGAGLTDGLFGGGGQEGEIGFFSPEKTKFNLVTKSGNTLTFEGLSNDEYNALFGTGYLDNTMVPDGIFWDDNEDPDDEGALIAWNNPSKGGWTYGTLDTEDNIAARLTDLATSLGVSVEDLGYESGSLVPETIVAAATANGLFEVEPVEDLRNANLNYTMTVGTIDGGEVTVRIAPKFAPIVASATSDYQLRNAIYVDTLAEVPYLNLLGNNEAYQDAISGIEEMSATEKSKFLNSIGFGYAAAFTNIGFEAARDQLRAVTRSVPWDSMNNNQDANSNNDSWLMQDGLYGFASQSGSRSSYDPVSNSLGYDIDVYSLSAGIEKRLNGTNSSLGLAVGYTDSEAEAYQNQGKIDADGYSVTAFTRTRFGAGGLVQASVGYQDLSYDSSREAPDQSTATANTDGSQVFAALNVDYLKDMGGFKVGPTASIEYYDVSVDGFTENSAGIWNLEVGDQDSDILLASIGARGEYQFPTSNTRLTGSVKYTNASGDDLAIKSGFIDQNGLAPYTVKGMDEDLVDVSVGVDHVIRSNASSQVAVYGGYNGTFGSNYDSQGLQIGLNTTF